MCNLVSLLSEIFVLSIKTIIFFVVSLAVQFGLSQNQTSYRIRTVAFYNVENLFDTENDSLTLDDDRTPGGKDQWTVDRYEKKIAHMAKVLSEIGRDIPKTSPDIIGLCEVENRQVIEDLLNHPYLRAYDYGAVHYDSPDERGIDVALIYKKSAFIPSSFKSHRLLLFNDEGFRDYTRDQLVVGGHLDNEEVHFIVNHWPSRSGGEVRSRPNRIAAAKLNTRIIDSILSSDIDAKIIGMGDFNDDPINDSFKKILKTFGEVREADRTAGLFNPMERLFKKGVGSLAYRDQWNLFDQIYCTPNFISEDKESYSFWKAGVYSPQYLIDPSGKYKGYPLRTYAGGSYIGGYSDHFPVYLYLIRKVKP